MFSSLGRRLFGSVNDRTLKPFYRYVDAINALEPAYQAMSDSELQQQTAVLKAKLAEGKTLDDILPEAFAVVREAAVRTLHMRHFDVQLLGGIVLHKGMISEMRTGEGKTLVSTLPVYLNALEGKGVHVVTVNDYLAERDSEWMGKIFRFLGMSVGCIIHGVTDEGRREAYYSDITYGTNNEFGFDYLRDNMKFSLDHMVQREFNYAVVDEVDSILIDEARTPLIISGPTEDNSVLYTKVNALIPQLIDSDYEKDEKARTVTLTEDGTNHMEELLQKAGLLKEGSNLYDIENIALVHHSNQALRAHKLFTRDVDYMIKDDMVMIIDEFTGRMMEGRRYSEGLHQALEAKENVTIQNENQTLASITFQNYFRLYPKLAGMTGTAMTEAAEFADIYKLEVVEIPTHLPVKRIDEDDEIYCSAEEKYKAIIKVIEERHAAGQPILVGTISIEKSEHISGLLKKKKIPHNVLNARYHEQEASIIAQAGRFKAVTIATNMAGRGTDIKLGGNPDMLIEAITETDEDARAKQIATITKQVEKEKQKVLETGGLLVLATERHESRRIDNQLRGRSGRQGDPGRTKFYLSLEDDLMRIFGSDRMGPMLQKLGLKEDEAIHHKWISRALEKAQQKVEARNYDIRKNLLKYDDVMSEQRKVIYEQRIELMKASDVSDTIEDMRSEVNESLVSLYIPQKSYAEEWDVETLRSEIYRIYGINLPIADWAKEEGIAEDEILQRTTEHTNALFAEKEAAYSAEIMRMAEKRFLLITLDQLWKDHLLSLDHLRQGINLRAYGQKDPLNEYKREAFMTFDGMLTHLRYLTIERLAHMEVSARTTEEEGSLLAEDYEPKRRMQESRMDPALMAEAGRDAANENSWGKVGRNEDCPCGSGNKYKHCHGKLS
jgi:preprotein translocase subunit SecA